MRGNLSGVRKRQTIRWKLTRVMMATSTTALLMACSIFVIYDYIRVSRESVETLETLAQIIGENSTAALAFGDPQSADRLLASLAARGHLVAACIYTQEGKEFAHYPTKVDWPCPAETGEAGVEIRGSAAELFSPILLDEQRVGTVYLRDDLTMIRLKLLRYAGLALLVLMGSNLVAFWMSQRLQAVVSKPVSLLAATARAVAAEKNYTLRAVKQGNDELGDLTDHFNAMLSAVEERDMKLESHRQELEGQVSERTAALTIANRELLAEVVERKEAQRRIEERTLYLNSLFDNSPIAILSTTPDGHIQMCNRAFEEMFQYTPEEVVGKNVYALIVPKGLAAEETEITRAGQGGGTKRVTTQRRRKDDSLVDVQVSIVPLTLNGKVVAGYRLYQDISDYKHAEAALQDANGKLSQWVGELELRNSQMSVLAELEDLLQSCRTSEEAYEVIAPFATALFPGSAGAVYMLNSERRMLESVTVWGNPPMEVTAFEPENCWATRRGKVHAFWGDESGVRCAHVRKVAELRTLCLQMMAQGETLGVLYLEWMGNTTEKHEDGHQESYESRQRRAVSLADNIGLALANLRLRERLHSSSIRDPLTGLHNRRYLVEYLEPVLARAQRERSQVSVVMLDLDHFKKVNDTYGHDAGDEVLRAIARVLKAGTRTEDLPSRYGGEEFVLVLQGCNAEDATNRVERLFEKVRGLEMRHDGKAIGPLTLSGGIAVYPENGQTADELLREADRALYVAKGEGRDRVVLASGMVEAK